MKLGSILASTLCVGSCSQTFAETPADAPATARFSRHVRPTPPIPPPPQIREFPAVWSQRESARLLSIPVGLTIYSIGNPTDEEQLYLELINRSRANPAAEGERFRTLNDPDVRRDLEDFKVDLDKLVADFNAINPAPPLSLNANLSAAARLHSLDMLTNQFQGHAGRNGSTTGDRITAQGYPWNAYGENVFSNARSVSHGHAAFDIDWGVGETSVGGVQNPPGHRNTIHDPVYREIGIGAIVASNGKVGPQLITQDFASRRNLTPLVTGVAYYDLNQNNFYDLGEGIEGATILVLGSQFYAVSAASGGYSVPVPGNGTYTATFGLLGASEVRKNAVVANNQNVKVDFTPVYSPPLVSGPEQPAVGQSNRYQFTVVGGAQSYEWKQNKRIAATEGEGAENGTAKIEIVASAGYDVIDSAVRAAGRFSFHLAHPQKEDQVLTLKRLYRLSGTSQLVFSSRLGWAGTAQTAKAQVSIDSGATWQDVWLQVGAESSGQSSFSLQTIPLGRFAGQEIRVRFRFDFGSGSFLADTDPGVGFYLDDIGVTDADELLDEVVSHVSSGAAFVFNPRESGDYALRVRGRFASRAMPWGPAKLVTAQSGGSSSPFVRIIGVERLSSSQLQIDFEATGTAASGFDLESASVVDGAWTTDFTASISPLPESGKFRAVSPMDSGARRFYRVRAR
jgi:uncharacterized protein YkwD